MEFLVVPAGGDVRHLLGLGLEERGARMLAAAGLAAAKGPSGEGALVLYPGERVGPGALGKEIAALVPEADEVIAATGGAACDAGRPVLVLGSAARRRLFDGADSAEAAYAKAAAGTVPRMLQAPTMPVTDRPSRARAKAMLLHSLRKPIDGLVSRTLNRPISIAVSSLLVETPLTPNHLSVICFLLALAAAGLMVAGLFWQGALLMHVSSILDGCDGEVARLKYQSSKLGGWLDTIFDDVSNNVFALATGIGLFLAYRGDGRPQVGLALLAMAATGFALVIPAVVTTYRRLVRGGVSDSGSLVLESREESSGWRRFVLDYLMPLGKRDTYLLLYLLAAIAGLPEAIVVLYVIGASIAAATLLSDPAARAA